MCVEKEAKEAAWGQVAIFENLTHFPIQSNCSLEFNCNVSLVQPLF